jgi:toxin ParE1/3/4
MAYKLIWSPAACGDLKDIVRFISRDSRDRAVSFALRLMSQADLLQEHPEIGRNVPEHRDPVLREIIYKPYRIVYRLNPDQRTVEIVRVWHAARGVPKIP